LFGRTVALSGTTALIGAPGVAGFTGAAYVFTRTATGWARQATLTAPSGQPGESLALDALAISGNTAVVGEELNNNFAGAAYEFVRTGTAWAQKAKFTAVGGTPNDRLGRGVAIAGTGTALVGAPGHNNFHGQPTCSPCDLAPATTSGEATTPRPPRAHRAFSKRSESLQQTWGDSAEPRQPCRPCGM